jgi:hypothetical protein
MGHVVLWIVTPRLQDNTASQPRRPQSTVETNEHRLEIEIEL